jgi:hypothetical protein
MAVPGSGELSLKKLAKEKHFDNYNSNGVISGAISLKDVTVGGTANSGLNYDTTNTQSPSFPDNNTGYGMTEFYSYDHDFVAISCSKAMDVVFLLDYTGSMGSYYNNATSGLKTHVDDISDKIVSESGGDYRLAAVLIDQTGGEGGSTPSYWSGNNTTVSNLPSANKYNSGEVWLSAVVPFANANKSDFDTKIGYLAGSTNSATSMLLGSGNLGPEPNDTAIDRVLNHNLAGTFRTGVTRMIILITDNSPDGDGDDAFDGAEELAKMGTLSNQAVANVCTISVLGNFVNTTSSDGTTTRYDVYNGYANNTGGLTNFNGDPSDIVDFIEDICDDISNNFPTFNTVSLPATNIDSTPTGSVSASSVSDSRFDATLVVSDLNSNLTTYWKPWARNNTGTAYGSMQTTTASNFRAHMSVNTNSTIFDSGVLYGSTSMLASSGTSTSFGSPSSGSSPYALSGVITNTANQGVDNMGWTYCNSGYSQTPIVNYNNNVPGGATGNQIAYYSGSNTTGTKTQTINEGSVPLLSGNTYRLRGWFERKNNGGIVYSSNIVSFTVGSTFDFTATISVGNASYYTTQAYGWSSTFPFSMGTISNVSFNGSTLSAVYFQDNPTGTDYIYIYFSGTRKTFSSMYIGLQNLGGSSNWTAIGSNIWRKASSTAWAEGSSMLMRADY